MLRPLILTLLFSCSAFGQPSIISPTESVPIGGFADVEIRGLQDPESLAWVVIPETRVRVYSAWGTADPILAIPTNQTGTWTIVVAAIEAEKVWQQKVELVVGKPGPPTPHPDDEDEEDEDPTPPGPSGFRVLILRETGDRTSREHRIVLNSTEVRGYLNQHAVTGSDGKTREWRIWDDDYTAEQLSHVEPHWREAYEQAKQMSNGVRPWIHVTNGREGASRTLPTSVAETLTLLKEFAE